MSIGILFFATSIDIHKILQDINCDCSIDIIDSNYCDHEYDVIRHSVNTISNLGINIFGDHTERPITIIKKNSILYLNKTKQYGNDKYLDYQLILT